MSHGSIYEPVSLKLCARSIDALPLMLISEFGEVIVVVPFSVVRENVYPPRSVQRLLYRFVAVTSSPWYFWSARSSFAGPVNDGSSGVSSLKYVNVRSPEPLMTPSAPCAASPISRIWNAGTAATKSGPKKCTIMGPPASAMRTTRARLMRKKRR